MKNYILIFLFAFFYTTNIFACKCEPYEDIKTEFNSTDLIIRAKVISLDNVNYLNTLNKKGKKIINNAYEFDKEKVELINVNSVIKLELEVIETYKGKNSKKRITIYTSKFSSNCGYKNFEIGKEYQVYLSKKCYFDFIFKKAKLKAKNYNGYWTNICTRTKAFNSEEDKILKLMGENK